MEKKSTKKMYGSEVDSNLKIFYQHKRKLFFMKFFEIWNHERKGLKEFFEVLFVFFFWILSLIKKFFGRIFWKFPSLFLGFSFCNKITF